MTTIIEDVKEGNIRSALVRDVVDKAIKILTESGMNLISLEQTAKLRIKSGLNSKLIRQGHLVREGAVTLDGKNFYLVEESPYLELKRISEIPTGNFPISFGPSEREIIEDSIKRSVKFPYVGDISIPSNRLAEEEVSSFMFKESAEEYGKLLEEVGITQFKIISPTRYASYNPSSERIRPITIDGIVKSSSYSSTIHSEFPYRSGKVNVRGAFEGYTPEQIHCAFIKLGIQGLEEQVLRLLGSIRIR